MGGFFGQWQGASAGQWWGYGQSITPPDVVVPTGAGGTFYMPRRPRKKPRPVEIEAAAQLLPDAGLVGDVELTLRERARAKKRRQQRNLLLLMRPH